MANENAKIDQNYHKTLLGVTDDANQEIRRLLVDATTGRLKCTAVVTAGAITSLNGLTAAVQLFATGTTGTDFNISSATATHTFNIPDAGPTARGLVTTGGQTIAGVKTFSSFPVTPSSAPSANYEVANKKYVDDSIAPENTWDRALTVLSPHNAGDSVRNVADYNGLIITANTGVVATGTWQGTAVAIGYGGTGAATKTTAFDALSPMSQTGDIIYGGALGTGLRLGIGGANTVLHGGISAPAYSAVVEADISLSAGSTTNNTIVGTHGFAPALSGLNTQFLRGDGAWAIPGGTTVPNAYTLETVAYTANVEHTIVHNFGTFPVVQAFDNTATPAMIVPYIVRNIDANTVGITFTISATYTVILTIGSPPLTAYTSTSGNYAMLAGDYLIEETGSGKIVTLLTPVGRSGKTVIIKNTSAGVCDVQTAAGTIDGIADVTLASYDSLTVVSNGTIWLVI